MQDSKIAIVTGGSRGIGAAIARRLADDGMRTVVNFSGDAGAADDVVRDIRAAGGKALAVKADISDASAVSALFQAARDAFGGVDILVNNAGILSLSPIAEADDSQFDRQIAVNLKGAFNTMREAARQLRDGGRIITLSSSVIGLALPSYGLYAATKAGVEAMTGVLAKELGARGITVNAVAPGPTATDLFLDGKSPETVARMAGLAPLGRLGEPRDIAAVVAFLAGPGGGWINGQTLRANGGMV
ncbi:MAG: SDR family oxidoreductase [Telmatospirillum sp.]|nr:SDR family oxidoreductase [Telmatospirillum sp.]